MREETQRLVLRDLVESDIAEIVTLFSEEDSQYEILENQRDPKFITHYAESELVHTKTVEYAVRTYLAYAVEEKETGDLIGTCNISNAMEGCNSNIGWHIGCAHSGLGYATELARELIRIGIEDRNVARIYGDCFESNVASINVFIKVGMKPVPYLWFKKRLLSFMYAEQRPIVRYELKSVNGR